jgi:hypothetical protein
LTHVKEKFGFVAFLWAILASNNTNTFTGNAFRWLAVKQNSRTKYVRFTAWKRDEFGGKMEEMSPWKQWRAEPYKTEEERAADPHLPPPPKGILN